ncbi:DUF3841 domain-containing protein [Clostridium sp. CX1]|nr:DUF3841 domain-containing protein [Clostridium sp. CX1]MCT8975057.1 DUF3841 domain-containing protein [Clostridium sp. CX1]
MLEKEGGPMDNKIRVWTRQDEKILNVLEKDGRHIAKREYIEQKMEDCSKVYLDVYTWYTEKAKDIVAKPSDVQYPIWVSLSSDNMLQPVSGTVILELLIDRDLLIVVDLEKWGRVVNYWYVPLTLKDEEDYDKKLKNYGITNNSNVYLSNFYPHLKKEVIKSWDRLFDNSYSLSDLNVGTIWEVKKEWIQKIIK